MGFKRYALTPRVINDLNKRSAIGIYFYFVVIGIVLVTDNYYDRHVEFSQRFLFFITGICLFRLLHRFVAGRVRQKFEKVSKNIFLLSIALTGLIWGVGLAAFMIQEGEPNAKMLMVMCSAGLCAGGVVAYIPELRLSIAFCFSLLLPAISTVVFYQANISLVIALSLFLMYMCFMAYNGNREYWDALENEYLLEEKSKDLEKISRIDGLTGLYTRRYFDEVFTFEWNRSIRNQTPISIILCDIDHFKQVNDQHGHLAGDEYLKEISGLFKKVFRRETDITARYGGEEFIVLMSGESLEKACTLAETIRSATEKFFLEYQGRTIQNTISLGVATMIPHKTDKMEFLISRADKALYQSKTRGRNKVTQNSGPPIFSLQ